MTRRASVLHAIAPEAHVSVHPDDLKALDMSDGEQVTVSSRRGTITLKSRADTAVARGSIFIPFHFREAAVNLLTLDALDPDGKIPAFKYCAVRIEKAN